MEAVSPEWQSIYRTYTDAELTAEKTKVKAWLDNPFISQTMGERAYVTSLSENRDRLQAICAVQQERSGGGAGQMIEPDFSGTRLD